MFVEHTKIVHVQLTYANRAIHYYKITGDGNQLHIVKCSKIIYLASIIMPPTVEDYNKLTQLSILDRVNCSVTDVRNALECLFLQMDNDFLPPL